MKRSLLFAVTLFQVWAVPAVLLAQDATAIAPRPVPAPKGASDTLWHLVQSGGWAMVPLGIMSVLMVMLIVAYALTLRRGAVFSNHFMNTAEVLLKKRDYAGLLAISSRQGEAIARIVHRMLDFAAKNPNAPFEVVREIAQTEGNTQAASIQNRVTYLADIAILSPMVGLLGTVSGIIRSFGGMANAVADSSRMQLLSGGVSEALFATLAGLAIGITSMAFYGIFRNKVQSLLSDLERASAHLLGVLAVQFEQREPQIPSHSITHPPRQPEPERTQIQDPRRKIVPPPKPSVTIDDEF